MHQASHTGDHQGRGRDQCDALAEGQRGDQFAELVHGLIGVSIYSCILMISWYAEMALLRTCRNSSLVSSAFCSAMATVCRSSFSPDRNRCAASVAFWVACSTVPTLVVSKSENEDGAALPAGLTEGNGPKAGKLGLRIGRMVVGMGYRRISSDLWIMSFTAEMADT